MLLCRPRKQMPTDPIQAMEFAQSKGQARKDGRTGVTFADVAGCDEAVRQLRFVVEASSKQLPICYFRLHANASETMLLNVVPGMQCHRCILCFFTICLQTMCLTDTHMGCVLALNALFHGCSS